MGKISEIQEIEAVRQVKSGDNKAFALIYKKYKELLINKLSLKLNGDREKAKDISNDIFIKVMEKLNNGDYVEGKYTFNSWFTRVSDNYFIDLTRKRKIETTSISNPYNNDGDESEGFEIQISDGSLNAENSIIRQETIDMVKKAISKLTEREQMALQLRYDVELSYEEIAVELDITLACVKSTLFIAKKRLAELLGADKKINLFKKIKNGKK
jgi:RNA polymerase sigma-70 factor, ECF subfamily